MKIRLAVLALLLAAPLQAQSGGASDVMTRAVSAYQDLEFDVAANLLRRLLAAPLANELDDSTRALALTYLGAAEHYRGNADSAIAAFRRLVSSRRTRTRYADFPARDHATVRAGPR